MTSGVPAAPSNVVVATLSNTSLSLSWTDNSSNETSFQVQRSTSQNGSYTTVATLPANTTTYTDAGLGLSVAYYYKITAQNSAGSSAAASGMGQTSAPNGPWGLAVSANSSSSLHLTWSGASVNETGFVVLRSTSLNGTYSTAATLPANTTSWDDAGLTSGTTYYYQVYAINDVGSSGTTNASGSTNP